MMKEILGTPVDLIISPYTVVFRVRENEEDEIKRTELAKFFDTTFCVIDEETGEEIYTEPITYSMN
jgi:hypothetical protein